MKKIFLALVFTSFLASCGIKPSEVDPPEGVDPLKFPRTYPSPDMDTK